jgi:glycosyltransferase involved in cell wall biosynthesis
MILGYHYHVPVLKKNDQIFVPSYIGVFLNALADQVSELRLFLHEEPDTNAGGYDFLILHPKIKFCSMGKKSPAWDRLLFPSKFAKEINQDVASCDILLLRAPSPLVPFMFNYFQKKTNVTILLVGDYATGIKHLVQPWYRLIPIAILLKRNDHQLRRILPKAMVYANSIALKEKYTYLNANIELMTTSSLTLGDFYIRENTCLEKEVKLLYTGRLDLAKGLKELIEAASILNKNGRNISVHFVAWEDNLQKPVEKLLQSFAQENGMDGRVYFHGKKSVGEELNAMYRMADIYVIPSYHEGFPRTIWEAMANSLPVISTPVGGIPHLLTHGKELLFAEVANSTDLSQKIEEMISEPDQRMKLIQNARDRAKESALEVQVEKLIQKLSKYFSLEKSHA